jgi:membrane-associated protein
MLDFTEIIRSSGALVGLVLIGTIIFAESGLLVGFFLPGDTLLFPAGFFAAQGILPLPYLMAVVILCAIAGYEAGYRIGEHVGPRLFTKKDGILFRQEYVAKSEGFYEKHGGKTMLIGRFIPIIRTIAPVLAGVGSMPKKQFTTYNVLGAVLWGPGVILLGYVLGSRFPGLNIDKYIVPAILLAMAFTFAPTIWHIFSDPKTRALIKQRLRRRR